MKHFLRNSLLTLSFLVLAPLAAHAEQVLRLRDGSVLHGRVVSSANGVLTFETANGTMQIPESQVDRLEFVPDAGGTTAAPGATPPPSQPGPDGSSGPTVPVPGPIPAPERTPWPYATPAPAPGPSSSPEYAPRRRVVRRAPRSWERAAPSDGPLWLEGKVGMHSYSGTGWDSFGNERAYFDGPAMEGSARLLLDREPGLRLDFVSTLGIYGGTDDCISTTNNGSCVQMTITNLYGDVGGRATFFVEPLYLYGQAGVGLMSSTVDIQTDAAVLQSESRGSPSAHFLGGIGLSLEPFDVFAEVKYTASQAHFDILNQDLGMGGTTAMVGAGIHF